MLNIFDKNRNIFPKDEVLTQSFLIDKIANDMKAKYKKVFSVINYDENSLKNDIHSLLAKYISNKHREINIKFIETTILNKIREKYKKFKKPLNPINKNKKLIKLIYPSPNRYNSYLNLNKKSKTISALKDKRHLAPIKNNSINKNDEMDEKIEENYYTNENLNYNIVNNNEEEKKENEKENNEEMQIQGEEDNLKKIIINEQEEITKLEKYQEDLQKQIDEINKKIENHNQLKDIKDKITYQNKENINKELENENKINEINNDLNNDLNNEEYNNEIKDDNNIDSSLTYEQRKYLERKKRIEEDVYNKQNRYIFIKPRHYKINDEGYLNNNPSKSANNIYNNDNIRINKYSMEKLNDFNKIKEKIRLEKEKQKAKDLLKKSAKKISDYKEDIEKNKIIKEKELVPNISYEEKIKLRILQRSLEQEKAIEHLRNILYPQKQLIVEKKYQGFNGEIDEKNLMKIKELELADKARKLEIEKIKQSLEYSINDKIKKKNEELEIDKKYREIAEKEYELFVENEKKKKLEQAEKIEQYRKGLDEQIETKKKMMIDENNISDINKEFGLID